MPHNLPKFHPVWWYWKACWRTELTVILLCLKSQKWKLLLANVWNSSGTQRKKEYLGKGTTIIHRDKNSFTDYLCTLAHVEHSLYVRFPVKYLTIFDFIIIICLLATIIMKTRIILPWNIYCKLLKTSLGF